MRWSDLFIRFVLGGFVVSAFALLGDLIKPKSYAGIFSAAPSIALGTLGLAIVKHGGAYAAIEGRSMVIGGLALYVYSQVVSWFLFRHQWHSLVVSSAAVLLWLISAFALWFIALS